MNLVKIDEEYDINENTNLIENVKWDYLSY